ncbi:MAG: carbon storage regulator [Selenomonas ruminantium]|uniref:Translational regulator CsrA n=1 Tax=Selenomonas ruminantium TaxID=971 RepID=A0A927ZVM9_SELRU|nr:carbon storage regulator [Selenomonas ruminantium]
MLVLTRKANEEIMIGDNIIVNVVKVSGGKIKFGITAPPEVSIKREENPQKFAERAQARSTGERHGDSIKVDGHVSRQAAKAAFI